MRNRCSWLQIVVQLTVWAVIASVALMPGTVRASVVHVHDHGRHEHQQPLFMTAAVGAGHHHHDHPRHADDHEGPGPSHSDHPAAVTVVDQDIVGEAVTAQSVDAATAALIAAPLMLLFPADLCDSCHSVSPTSQRPSPDAHRSCTCRIVQTSHALLL